MKKLPVADDTALLLPVPMLSRRSARRFFFFSFFCFSSTRPNRTVDICTLTVRCLLNKNGEKKQTSAIFTSLLSLFLSLSYQSIPLLDNNHQRIYIADQFRTSLQSPHSPFPSSIYILLCILCQNRIDGFPSLIYRHFLIPHFSATFPIRNLFFPSCHLHGEVFPRHYRLSREKICTCPEIGV